MDKNKKTKFGQFLQKVGNTFGDVAEIGGSLLPGPAGTALSAVHGLLEGKAMNGKLPPELQAKAQEFKLELELAEKEFEKDLVQAQQAEMESARKYNADIQNDEDATTLAKITPYAIDITIIVTWVSATFYIAHNAFTGTDVSDGIWGLYSTVTGLATNIVGFHRGSSMGSKRKDKASGIQQLKNL